MYDIYGNLGEWVQDSWHDNYTSVPANGSAWVSGDSPYRVIRGGSWNDNYWCCRSASRDYYETDILTQTDIINDAKRYLSRTVDRFLGNRFHCRDINPGFRLVREI